MNGTTNTDKRRMLTIPTVTVRLIFFFFSSLTFHVDENNPIMIMMTPAILYKIKSVRPKCKFQLMRNKATPIMIIKRLSQKNFFFIYNQIIGAAIAMMINAMSKHCNRGFRNGEISSVTSMGSANIGTSRSNAIPPYHHIKNNLPFKKPIPHYRVLARRI
jgi:hypothetical protein